jgi:dephospho-CoA kinase
VLTLKKVAVTGGLSSGKSSVCKILKECGAYVVNSDDIVHQLLDPHTAIGQQIIELLGAGVVVDGQFDRKKIAQAVFENKKA